MIYKDKTILIKGNDLHSISQYDELEPIKISTLKYCVVDNKYIDEIENKKRIPTKYIINKNATILFWDNGDKTIVKRAEDDEYNKILGFLWAYFQHTSGLSKTKANDYLRGLVDEDELKAIAMIQDGTIFETMSRVSKGLSDMFNTFSENLRNQSNKIAQNKGGSVDYDTEL